MTSDRAEAPRAPRAPIVTAALAVTALGLAIMCWSARIALQVRFLVLFARGPDAWQSGDRHWEYVSRLVGKLAPSLSLAVVLSHLLWLVLAVRFARRTGAAAAPRTWAAAGVYFLPIANLVYPARHMRALFAGAARGARSPEPDARVEQPYRVSARAADPEPTRPSRLVGAWLTSWGVWQAAVGACAILARYFGWPLMPYVFLGVLVALVAALALSLVVVVRLTAAQRGQSAALRAAESARAALAQELEAAPDLTDELPVRPPRRRISRPPSVFVELEREMAARGEAPKRKRRRRKPAAEKAAADPAG